MSTVPGAGSYAHVPAEVEQDLDGTSTAGCTVFYVYELSRR
jgi:hypothetical protein